jgi:hypothetical protein
MKNLSKVCVYAALGMAILVPHSALSARVAEVSSGLGSNRVEEFPQQENRAYQQQYAHPYQTYGNEGRYGEYGNGGGAYGGYGGGYGGGAYGGMYEGEIGGPWIYPYPDPESEPGMGDDSNALYNSYLRHNGNGY